MKTAGAYKGGIPMKLTLSAPAKLNLFLDITGRRSDGYHLVSMVMQTVSVYDEVTVSLEESGAPIQIECTDSRIPADESNTAYRAAELFMKSIGREPSGVSIRIKKNIPSQAGMAGGSADAAAVLRALNRLTDEPHTERELAAIAEEIGADVPFCVYGGTMTAEGIGTILTPLPDMPGCIFVIVKPEVNVSTAEAYKRSDERGYMTLKSPERVTDGICSGDIDEIAQGLYNKFEEVLSLPEIDEIKRGMLEHGAKGALMTGSGSAVFGIFTDSDSAEKCRDYFSSRYEECFTAEPVTK